MEHNHESSHQGEANPVGTGPNPYPPPPPQQQVVYGRKDLPYRSTAFAVVLSALIPGLGQVYLGYYKHAFTLILVFASVVAGLSSGSLSGMEPLFGIFLGFFYFYQVVDAGRRASLINRYLDSGQSEALPEMQELPDLGGSLFAGGALIVIGTLALLNSVLDVSMEWLEDWWPLGLIVVGSWLVIKGRRK